MSEALELRVLSGLHREASCQAQDGALLGADPACDIVLADEGLGARAARLRIGARGWDLAPGDDAQASAPEPATPFNQPMPLGPVWVTVARRSDPWAELPEAANDGEAGTQEDEPAPAVQTTPAPSGDAQAAERAGEPSAASARPALPPAAPGRRGETWPMMLGLAAVVLTVLVTIAMAWLLPPSPPKMPERPDTRIAAERSLGQIAAALERLGLASRLHVNITPDGVVRVSGWVRNGAEQEAVAAALSQIWPMPALRISVEESAVATAVALLKSFGIKYQTRYDGDGRLTVRGIAASAQERDTAISTLRAQLPGMTILANDIALAADVSEALARELADAGLSSIALTWKGDRLEAGTSGLDDEQMAELETVIARFNTTHLGVAALARPSGDRQYADTVPFGIRSVVSGDTPFVVLEDGSKLLVGGTHKRYRLTAIEPKRLIFDGPTPAIVLR